MAVEDLVDNDRGILTAKDRKYLIGEIDLTEYKNPEKQDNTFRHRIRKRVKRGIEDFIFIDRYLDTEDWDKILEDWRETVEEIEDHTSRTGTVPEPSEFEKPAVFMGLRSGVSVILNSIAAVQGKEFAITFIEDNMKEIIQTQTALDHGEFYYGDISVQIESIDHKTIDIDDTFYRFEEILEGKAKENGGEITEPEKIAEALNEFVGELPEMPNEDYISLIDIFYLTEKPLSHDDYHYLRNIMAALIWEVEKPAFNEAVEDWNLITGPN